MNAAPQPLQPDSLVHAALAAYLPAHQGRPRLLCLSENATYAVEAGHGQRFVLRIHRPGYHSRAAIASELAWLAALHGSGIEVPRPLAGADGDCIQRASLPGHAAHWVVLFEWIDGAEPHPQQNLLASFERLGAINARLHRHARGWQRPAGFERLSWDHASMLGAHGHWGDWRQAPHVQPGQWALVEHTVAAIGEQLAGYGQGAERFGLIHADLRLANLLVDGAHTRVIDFDDCGFGWYLHDLASALSFHEHHADAPRWVASWLEGYSRTASLSQQDLAILPTLILQRRLQLLAWTGSHANTTTARQLGPEWVAGTLGLCQRYLADPARWHPGL